jgi:kynurenine--oxoglutarate transaminase/cysteine-S-conjugate beta-lyase/glutamine--phenylpyruvate transaminase
LAKLYSILLDKEIDSQNNILITLGAYEALYCSIMGIINPGDEVIIIDPHYDCYVPMVKIAGGLPVFIALKPFDENINNKKWSLDFDELESKFSDKTRLIIVNTPQNPTGKVSFTYISRKNNFSSYLIFLRIYLNFL